MCLVFCPPTRPHRHCSLDHRTTRFRLRAEGRIRSPPPRPIPIHTLIWSDPHPVHLIFVPEYVSPPIRSQSSLSQKCGYSRGAFFPFFGTSFVISPLQWLYSTPRMHRASRSRSTAGMTARRFTFPLGSSSFSFSLHPDLSVPSPPLPPPSLQLITQSLYHGHDRAMLLQNTLFRCGGAAIALTNKKMLIPRAKYRLRHLVCTTEYLGAQKKTALRAGRAPLRNAW